MPTTTAAVEAVWRIESGRLVAALARITGDFTAAEDLAQDALERALRQWPRDGVPDHPASWLMATAKHLAVDAYRRQSTLARKLTYLADDDARARKEAHDPMSAVDDDLDTAVHDDLLRLVFTTCHPALSAESQVALTLRTVAGCRPGRSPAPCWSPRRPWASGSPARRGPSPTSTSASSCRPPRSSRPALAPSSP